jgi:hypothetical protein
VKYKLWSLLALTDLSEDADAESVRRFSPRLRFGNLEHRFHSSKARNPFQGCDVRLGNPHATPISAVPGLPKRNLGLKLANAFSVTRFGKRTLKVKSESAA